MPAGRGAGRATTTPEDCKNILKKYYEEHIIKGERAKMHDTIKHIRIRNCRKPKDAKAQEKKIMHLCITHPTVERAVLTSLAAHGMEEKVGAAPPSALEKAAQNILNRLGKK